MSEPSLSKAVGGLVLAACTAVMVMCQGCTLTPMERARTIVAASAQGVVAVDRVIAPRYAAAVAAGNGSEIRTYNRVVETLLLTRSAILAAELSLDAAEAAGDGEVPRVVACIVSAVQRLLDVLPSVGVDMPEALMTVLSMSTAFVSEICDPHAGEAELSAPHTGDVMTVTP